MNRLDYLRKAGEISTGPRQIDYGPPEVNFANMSVGMSTVVGRIVEPWRAALVMASVKIARLASETISEDAARDQLIDATAYLAIAGELYDHEHDKTGTEQ